jgi:hypothetical protein
MTGPLDITWNLNYTRKNQEVFRPPLGDGVLHTELIGIEVNSSPGLESIESVTGKDVAGMVMEFIEKNARPNNTRTKGKG